MTTRKFGRALLMSMATLTLVGMAHGSATAIGSQQENAEQNAQREARNEQAALAPCLMKTKSFKDYQACVKKAGKD